MKKDSFVSTPLHLSCMDIIIENIPMLILNSYPEATTIIDNERGLQIHLLFVQNTTISLSLLQLLLQYNCTSVYKQDITGDTPVSIIQIRQKEITHYNKVMLIINEITTN